ncbi:ABC-three component system middle component 4 [Pseudomonas protegens]|uniref:ABC-three component system middle component 4 n=1 Tax=Pseudomonas protegens TaxID=380021 RepID=UPI003FD83859
MTSLPYIQPERELYYNLGVLLLVLGTLAETKKRKKILSIDKIQSFYFLTTRPLLLNRVLLLANKPQINIGESDCYTVGTLSPNVEELYDRSRLLTMLKILASKKFLSVEYSNSEGFLFGLTEVGKSKSQELNEGYFQKISYFIELLSELRSQTPSKLNGYINSALRQEAR